MPKTEYKAPTPIVQAKVIPFPSNKVVRKINSLPESFAATVAIKSLIKLYDKGYHQINPSKVYSEAKKQANARCMGNTHKKISFSTEGTKI